MATISRKNPIILANEFVRDFRQYESYMKHCVNILKTQNWLRENQHNSEVSNYKYMKEYMYKNGIDQMYLFGLNKMFSRDVLSKISPEQIHKINVNKYYVNGMATFADMISEISQIGGNLITGKREQKDGEMTNVNQPRAFKKLFHNVIIRDGVQIDAYRDYTEQEILQMIFDGDIMIVKSDVENSTITREELASKVMAGNAHFVDRDFSGGFIFESDMGDTFDLLEAKSEEERQVWFAKNMLLMQYLRKILCFDASQFQEGMIKAYSTFAITDEHIDEIIRAVRSSFSKRKKRYPVHYSELAKTISHARDIEKYRFNSPLKSTSSQDIIDIAAIPTEE